MQQGASAPLYQRKKISLSEKIVANVKSLDE
jgi:hypothetical protein